MRRRTVLGGALAAGAALSMPAYLRAQSNRKVSILTWNIADQEALFKEEFAEFQKNNPGVEIEWLDKKGPEVPVFYQTQLVARTPPDVINTQGALWVEYAANGALLDLTPYVQQDAEVAKRFNADYLRNCEEFHAPLLHHQDAALLQQDHVQGGRPRRAAEELRRDHVARPSHGEKREDRPSDPQLRLAVLALLQDGGRRAPLGGRQEGRLQHAEGDRGAGQAREGHGERRHQQDLLDRPLGRAERRLRLGHGRHAPRPCAGIVLLQRSGAMGERRYPRRRADARRLVDAEQPWARRLEGIKEPGTRFRAPEAHDLGQVDGRVHPPPQRPHREYGLRPGRARAPAQGRSAHRTGARDAARAYRQDDRQLAAAFRRAAEGRLLPRDPERGARTQGREDRARRRGAGGQPPSEPEGMSTSLLVIAGLGPAISTGRAGRLDRDRRLEAGDDNDGSCG